MDRLSVALTWRWDIFIWKVRVEPGLTEFESSVHTEPPNPTWIGIYLYIYRMQGWRNEEPTLSRPTSWCLLSFSFIVGFSSFSCGCYYYFCCCCGFIVGKGHHTGINCYILACAKARRTLSNTNGVVVVGGKQMSYIFLPTHQNVKPPPPSPNSPCTFHYSSVSSCSHPYFLTFIRHKKKTNLDEEDKGEMIEEKWKYWKRRITFLEGANWNDEKKTGKTGKFSSEWSNDLLPFCWPL